MIFKFFGINEGLKPRRSTPKKSNYPKDRLQIFGWIKVVFLGLSGLKVRRRKFFRVTIRIGKRERAFILTAQIFGVDLLRGPLFILFFKKVFMSPVSEEDVPGYHKFIAHPMDFCQMQKKFEMGQYKRVADIRSDFLLMMNNCATFNRDNKYFYDYGQRIRQICR